MKRVLVTGACGNIGANVVDLLVERGYSVRAVDLDSPAGRKAASRWGDQVDMLFGSICNDALVREAVAGMDHVIHLAAIVPPGTDVDQAASDTPSTWSPRARSSQPARRSRDHRA